MKIKPIKAWAVVEYSFVSDGSNQIAVFFNRSSADKWKKSMFSPDVGVKVIPVTITPSKVYKK